MNQPLITYRCTGKTNGLTLLFKYDLKGVLREFKIEEGELTDQQMMWLYSNNFPARESIMKNNWSKLKKYKKVFQVDRSPANLTFDALWEIYDHKIKKFESDKKFKKLKENEVIACFIEVPKYKKSIQRRNVAQTNLATFIHQKYYLDDWNAV